MFVSSHTGNLLGGFNIDTLLDNKQRGMTIGEGTDCQQQQQQHHHNHTNQQSGTSDSAFKVLRDHSKVFGAGTNSVADKNVLGQTDTIGTFISNDLTLTSIPSDQKSFHPQSHKEVEGESCSPCYQSPSSYIHDNLLHSMKSYDMSTQCISNINTSTNSNLILSAGQQPNLQSSWPLLDTAHPGTNLQPQHDVRPNRNLSSYGLKFNNSFMQLDNLSNISNIANLTNNYSPFSNIYSAMGQSHFGSHLGSSRMEPNVRASANSFPWTSTRGTGFLNTRYSGKWRNKTNHTRDHLACTRCKNYCRISIYDINKNGHVFLTI